MFCSSILTGLAIMSAPPPALQFDRDVRPILADNCFACHGPDRGSRKAGLRLDTRDGALDVLVPGDPETSEIMARLLPSHPDDRMPPSESAKSLTPDEIETIRLWIEDGAPWAAHWAFEPIATPTPPDVETHPIDAFLVARLDEAGLSPSPEADRETLIRRVTLDLTGLPPTIDEIDAFLADNEPGAWERVVDRLLGSPSFGERMATPWLDASRYADSYGYQSDQLSPTWPWRDWVVGAINDNMPYDDFIRAQLAGDLLPDATTSDRLATTFNRLHRMTNEGGSIELEYRTEYVADRVETMGVAFMGLTLGCARCHDHKFDPISQREFFSLSAFFNNIDEWGMYHDSSRVPTPSMLLPDDAQRAAIEARILDLARANEHLDRITTERTDAFRQWLDDPAPVTVDRTGHYTFDDEGTAIANHANPAIGASTSASNSRVEGLRGRALRFTGDDAASFPQVGRGLNPWEAFGVSFWIRHPEGLDDAILLHRTGGTDVGRFGCELAIRDGRLFFAFTRVWPGNAIAIRSVDPIEIGEWTHIGATWDASAKASGMSLFIDGRPIETEVIIDHLTKAPDAGGSGITFGERFRDLGFKGGLLDDLVVFDRAIAPIEVADLYSGIAMQEAIDARDEAALRPYFDLAIDAEIRAARQARADAVKALYDARRTVQAVPVMAERDETSIAHVLHRGEYDAPRTDETIVERGVPDVLPPLPDGPVDRLALAEWLVAPTHPLTSRVATNRIWQLFFGRGLVETSEDFGIQGARPTHPDLLDWLARDFMTDWDLKRLCRTIVTSDAYRRSSVWRPDDPRNDLYVRGPSKRLSAEMVRDLALTTSGLLDETMGGPPVSPYQPEGLWREFNTMSPGYRQSVGTALWRRSLYTVWKRTAPMPNMLAFDAAGREVCIMRRGETNTPVQALVLLNDPQFVEACRVLGERILTEGGDDDRARATFAHRLLTGRRPSADETDLLVAILDEQRAFFEASPEDATALRSIGSYPMDPALDPIDAAAATVLAQAIFNLDATIWKR